MSDQEQIRSGELIDIKETPDGEKLNQIAKILGAEGFAVLFRTKNAKCQNPKCENDHIAAMVTNMTSIDLADSMQALAKFGILALDREIKEKSTPSPFTKTSSGS